MSTILNQQATQASTSIPTTAETAIAETPVLYSGEQSPVYVGGSFRLTPGTAATTVTVRVRLGTGTSGTAIYTSPAMNVVATDPISVAIDMLDTSQAINTPNGTAYTVTVQQASATGNGSITDSYFRVEQQ